MDKEFLIKAIQEIEKKLDLGPCKNWTNSEFIRTSEEIFNASGIKISTSTIRRLFTSKEEELRNPQRETKNALAIFLNYKNWAAYINEKKRGSSHTKRNTGELSKSDLQITERSIKGSLRKLRIILYSLSSVLILSLISILIFGGPVTFRKKDYSKIVFEGSLLTSDKVPHTVIVHYDLKDAKGPFFVNWNDVPIDGSEPEKPTMLINTKGIITHTYYTKNAYNIILQNAKADSVKTLRSIIFTKGWECYVMQNEKIRAIDSVNFISKNILSAKEYLENDPLLDSLTDFRLFYRNMNPTGIAGENFSFKAFITPYHKNNKVECKHFQLEISGTKSFLLLTLMQEGCAGEASIICGKQTAFRGYNYDLSKLDLINETGTDLEIRSMTGKYQIFKNNELAFEFNCQEDLGEINGLRFEFKGHGWATIPLLTSLR